MFNSSNPMPGRNHAYAFGHQGGEISSVSLIFPVWEEIESVRAINLITKKAIPLQWSEWDSRLVITLELPKGQIVNPHLVVNETLSFKALLTPMHSLSTFDGLEFGDYTVFLRDHGVEKELRLGEEVTFSQEELTDLWVNDQLVLAGRAQITNFGSESDFFLSASACETVTYNKGSGFETSTIIKLGRYEQVTVVATPLTDGDELISVSVTN